MKRYLSTSLVFFLFFSQLCYSSKGLDQELFLHNGFRFLRSLQESNISKSDNFSGILGIFEEREGLCAGLSAQWVIHKHLGKEEHFVKVLETINNWTYETRLSETRKKEIYNFMEETVKYHLMPKDFNSREFIGYRLSDRKDIKRQTQLEYLYYDSLRGPLKLLFEESEVIMSRDMLQSRVEKILKPNVMLLLSSKKRNSEYRNVAHAVAVYKNKEGIISFYDSNNENGSISVRMNSNPTAYLPKNLVSEFWGATDGRADSGSFDFFEDLKLRKVNLYAYGFPGDYETEGLSEVKDLSPKIEEVKNIFDSGILEKIEDSEMLSQFIGGFPLTLKKELRKEYTENSLVQKLLGTDVDFETSYSPPTGREESSANNIRTLGSLIGKDLSEEEKDQVNTIISNWKYPTPTTTLREELTLLSFFNPLPYFTCFSPGIVEDLGPLEIIQYIKNIVKANGSHPNINSLKNDIKEYFVSFYKGKNTIDENKWGKIFRDLLLLT
jgi:hypothetical protein